MTDRTEVEGIMRGRVEEEFLLRWFGANVRVQACPDVVTYLSSQFAVDPDHLGRPRAMSPREIGVRVVSNATILDGLVPPQAGTVRPRLSFKTETYTEVLRSDMFVLLDQGEPPDHAFVGLEDGRWLAVFRGEPSGLVVTRLVRELVREDLLQRDALMFHGAGALTRTGLGVFLVGNSGAGKTSSSLRLAAGGGHVLGTDRALVVPVDDGWWVAGLPTSTRLGLGAVRAFGLLDQLSAAAPIRAINPFNPDLPHQSYLGMKEKKVSLANGEVAALLGSLFTAAAPLHRVLVLQAGPRDIFRREIIEPCAARHLLTEHLMEPDADYPDRWVRREPAPPRPQRLAELIDRLVAQVEVERVVWSPPVHCDEETTQRLTGVHT